MTILSILNQLASTSSRLEKESILQANKDNETLKRTFALALDPILNFYIKKIPARRPTTDSSITLDHAYSSVLEALSSRKVTGNAAIEYLVRLLSTLSEDDAEVLGRVIDRDLRCGVQAATVNKIWPGLVHEFPVMLASKISDVKIDQFPFPAFVQKKSDGMRVQIVCKDDNIKIFSRNGKELNVQGVFDSRIKRCSSWVFDGELLAYENGQPLPRTIGNGICNKAIKNTITLAEATKLHVVLWDAIPYDDWINGCSSAMYSSRLGALQTCFKYGDIDPTFFSVMDTMNASTLDDVHYYFEQARRRGEEGVMLKSPSGTWESKRVKHQVKFKGIYDADLKCTGWEAGTKKNEGKIGAYLLESSCGRLKVKVGTGLTDDDRAANPEEAVGKIIAIQYNDIVKDKRSDTYSLFLPRFLEVREDKDTADTLDDLIKQVKEEV